MLFKRAPAPPQPFAGTVALTGANGAVARLIAPFLAPRVARFRLVDRDMPDDVRGLYAGQEPPAWVCGDLADPAVAAAAVAGADAVVHCAAVSTEAPFDELLPANIQAVANLFAAAQAAKVGRLVLASSMHVMGFYDRATPIDESMPPRPDSFYAVTKLFAENLGALYAEKAAMAVTALRLGHVCAAEGVPEPGNHIAPEDVATLILKALERTASGFIVVHAAATPAGGPAVSERRFLPDSAFTTPRESKAAGETRLRAWWGDKPLALAKRGGIFAAMKLPPLRKG
jgi:uronate dehydrogenase